MTGKVQSSKRKTKSEQLRPSHEWNFIYPKCVCGESRNISRVAIPKAMAGTGSELKRKSEQLRLSHD